MKQRIQSGSAIIEVTERPGDENVLLTVSKERYDEDRVDISLPRYLAKALGIILTGDA